MSKENKSITFRLGEKIFDGIGTEAKRKQISVNTLINQVLQDHLEWYGDAAKAGWIPMAKGWISSLLNKCNEEEIIELAKESWNYPKETILLFTGEFTVQSAFEVYSSWVKAAGLPCSITIRGNEYNLVVQHDMGKNWSLFMGELTKNVYQSLGSKVETLVSDNTLSVKITIP